MAGLLKTDVNNYTNFNFNISSDKRGFDGNSRETESDIIDKTEKEDLVPNNEVISLVNLLQNTTYSVDTCQTIENGLKNPACVVEIKDPQEVSVPNNEITLVNLLENKTNSVEICQTIKSGLQNPACAVEINDPYEVAVPNSEVISLVNLHENTKNSVATCRSKKTGKMCIVEIKDPLLETKANIENEKTKSSDIEQHLSTYTVYLKDTEKKDEKKKVKKENVKKLNFKEKREEKNIKICNPTMQNFEKPGRSYNRIPEKTLIIQRDSHLESDHCYFKRVNSKKYEEKLDLSFLCKPKCRMIGTDETVMHNTKKCKWCNKSISDIPTNEKLDLSFLCKPNCRMIGTDKTLKHNTKKCKWRVKSISVTPTNEKNKSRQATQTSQVKFNLQNVPVLNEKDLASLRGAKLEPIFSQNSKTSFKKIKIVEVKGLKKIKNTCLKTTGSYTKEKNRNRPKPKKLREMLPKQLFSCRCCSFKADTEDNLKTHYIKKHNHNYQLVPGLFLRDKNEKEKEAELQKNYFGDSNEISSITITDNDVLCIEDVEMRSELQKELCYDNNEVQLLPKYIPDEKRINNLFKMIHDLKDQIWIQNPTNTNELLEIFNESEEMLIDMLLISQRNVHTEFTSCKDMPYSEHGLEKIESYINVFAQTLLKKNVL